jgi:transposase
MPRPHPPEFRARAVELAREHAKPLDQIAKDLGISSSCLRNWVKQAAIDRGARQVPGVDQYVSRERAEHRARGGRAATRELGRAIEHAICRERGEQRSRCRVPTRGRIFAWALCAHAEPSQEQEVVEPDDVFDDIARRPFGARRRSRPLRGRYGVRD